MFLAHSIIKKSGCFNPGLLISNYGKQFLNKIVCLDGC